MDSFISILIIIAISGLQYVLSGTIKFKYSGAILPVVFAILMFYFYLIAQKIGFWGFLVILIVGEVLLLSIWDNRYEVRQKKSK